MKNPCHEYTIRNGGSTALRNELPTMLTLLTIFTLLTLPTQLQSERAIMSIRQYCLLANRGLSGLD